MARPGNRVLIADWRADWTGMGIAEFLARDGCQVTLAVNGICAGQELQSYVRDQWVGTLHALGINIVPYARLFGIDDDTVYLQHTASQQPITCENIDTLVLALHHEPENHLESKSSREPNAESNRSTLTFYFFVMDTSDFIC